MKAEDRILFREVTTTNKRGVSVTHKYKGKKSKSPRCRNRRNYEKRFLNNEEYY